MSWTCRSSVQGLESRKFCHEDGSTVFFWDTIAGVRTRPAMKDTRARLTLNDGVVGDVQCLERGTVFSQCVDMRPVAKVVGRQSERLDVNKSSGG